MDSVIDARDGNPALGGITFGGGFTAGSIRHRCVSSILVPVDFSPASLNAVQQAIALATEFNAALTLLHVIDLNAPADLGPAAECMTRLWRYGSEQMMGLASSISRRIQIQTQIQEGLPWSVIVEQSSAFDLIVLGREPTKRRAWRPFACHTAQRVMDRAACPVLVVNQQDVS